MMPPPELDVYEAEQKTDAFHATLLWEKIVMHLERSVKSGRRTQGWRTFENCFPGSKAVECLTAYLNTIVPQNVKRSQVRTLCQKLLLTGVLEDVKNREMSRFRESRLYRFTKRHFWEVPQWQDDKSPGIPRSKSAEHTLRATGDSEKSSTTMKGYASDSTIAPLSVVCKKQQQTVNTLTIKCTLEAKLSDHTIISQHCKEKEKAGSMLKPGQKLRKPLSNGQERSLLCQKPVSLTAKIIRKNKDVCKESQKSAMPAEETKTHRASVHFKRNRHSLNCKEFRRNQESDPVLLSSHHNVEQKMVFLNKATLHRSHSFSSSSAGSGSAPAESHDQAKNKWIVYGFI